MNDNTSVFVWRTARSVTLTAAMMLLLGCGAIYTSPSVKESLSGDVNVREISLTAETVLLANQTPYKPRSLPREFSTSASARQGPGLGALPSAPPTPDEVPQSMELRIPPNGSQQPYQIGVGDVVLLATKSGGSSIEELSGLLAAQQQRQGYTVSDDGSISIPDIGRVEIGGLTLQEAQDSIFKFLLDNEVDPAFSLEIAEYNSRQVTVGGAVRNSVRVPITLTPLSLGEALAASGGEVIQDEQYASIRIYRDGTLYQIPYEDFLSRPDLKDLRLEDGDAVFVDTTYDLDRAFEFYRQQIDVIQLRNQARKDAIDKLAAEISLRRGVLQERRSNFEARSELGAEPRDYVYLTGEVKTQSRIPLPYEQHANLADVLYGNGGFPTETGNASHIYVLRQSSDPSESGAVTAWHLDAGNSVKLTLATRMEMRPNDIVFIEEQPITKWGRSLQQLLPAVLNTAGRAASN